MSRVLVIMIGVLSHERSQLVVGVATYPQTHDATDRGGVMEEGLGDRGGLGFGDGALDQVRGAGHGLVEPSVAIKLNARLEAGQRNADLRRAGGQELLERGMVRLAEVAGGGEVFGE